MSAAGAAGRNQLGHAAGLDAAKRRGEAAALFAGASSPRPDTGGEAASAPPDWARKLRSEQALRHHRHAALQAIREGDRGGGAAIPDIKEKEE